jgi:hypothetical protein
MPMLPHIDARALEVGLEKLLPKVKDLVVLAEKEGLTAAHLADLTHKEGHMLEVALQSKFAKAGELVSEKGPWNFEKVPANLKSSWEAISHETGSLEGRFNSYLGDAAIHPTVPISGTRNMFHHYGTPVDDTLKAIYAGHAREALEALPKLAPDVAEATLRDARLMRNEVLAQGKVTEAKLMDEALAAVEVAHVPTKGIEVWDFKRLEEHGAEALRKSGLAGVPPVFPNAGVRAAAPAVASTTAVARP